MKYNVGDELVLKVEENFGYADKTYRSVKVQIIAYTSDYSGDYLVYVPQYDNLQTSFVLTQQHAKKYNIDKKFIGEDAAFIGSNHPIYKHFPRRLGNTCKKCNEFIELADDNDDDYNCRACRENPWR